MPVPRYLDFGPIVERGIFRDETCPGRPPLSSPARPRGSAPGCGTTPGPGPADEGILHYGMQLDGRMSCTVPFDQDRRRAGIVVYEDHGGELRKIRSNGAAEQAMLADATPLSFRPSGLAVGQQVVGLGGSGAHTPPVLFRTVRNAKGHQDRMRQVVPGERVKTGLETRGSASGTALLAAEALPGRRWRIPVPVEAGLSVRSEPARHP